jgi:poly(A)-specific ribonuclease
MEVDSAHFRQILLSILNNISAATYVTFDLEMSGITTRPKHGTGDRSHDVGKPSLQQQYEEMKSAAETFQILQIGITCVEEDREKGMLADFIVNNDFGHSLTCVQNITLPGPTTST